MQVSLCPADLIPLREAARLIPPHRMGRSVHVSTLIRWGKQGRIQLYRANGLRVSLTELKLKFGARAV